jgi:peptidoglycan-associated lipoprotein
MEVPAFMTERIFFDFDKSALKLEAQALLKKKAEWLKANPAAKLLVEGNCDERGTAEYNLALGERRAESAKKFLVDLGIDAKRISTISYGEERPIDPRHTEEAWAKNRNDGFVIN